MGLFDFFKKQSKENVENQNLNEVNTLTETPEVSEPDTQTDTDVSSSEE